jgi:predicted esterase
MRLVSVSTVTHGRVFVEDPADSFSTRILIGCHGYGQNADAMLEEMRRIPGADNWRLVSVQALHRFYTRNDQKVVASWMTREDRDDAIADNIEYLNRVVEISVEPGTPAPRTPEPRNLGTPEPILVFLGFSQGASMAARAAARGATRASGLILLGGDIPPDIKDDPSVTLPPTLVGCGTKDTWYGARLESDVAFLEARTIPHEVVRFQGGHEFTDEFREAVGRWLDRTEARR